MRWPLFLVVPDPTENVWSMTAALANVRPVQFSDVVVRFCIVFSSRPAFAGHHTGERG